MVRLPKAEVGQRLSCYVDQVVAAQEKAKKPASKSEVLVRALTACMEQVPPEKLLQEGAAVAPAADQVHAENDQHDANQYRELRELLVHVTGRIESRLAETPESAGMAEVRTVLENISRDISTMLDSAPRSHVELAPALAEINAGLVALNNRAENGRLSDQLATSIRAVSTAAAELMNLKRTLEERVLPELGSRIDNLIKTQAESIDRTKLLLDRVGELASHARQPSPWLDWRSWLTIGLAGSGFVCAFISAIRPNPEFDYSQIGVTTHQVIREEVRPLREKDADLESCMRLVLDYIGNNIRAKTPGWETAEIVRQRAESKTPVERKEK